MVGGWSSLVEGIAGRARQLGVRIETGHHVASLPTGAVIVAIDLVAARRLLGDDSLIWEGARTALLDVGLVSRRGDPFVVSDLDEAGWVERFTAPDPSLAPAGHSLLQAQLGLRPGESLDSGITRLERLLDESYVDWRAREVWRRRSVVDGKSGALDLPGTSWRDRPARPDHHRRAGKASERRRGERQSRCRVIAVARSHESPAMQNRYGRAGVFAGHTVARSGVPRRDYENFNA